MPTIVNGLAIGDLFSGDFAKVFFFDLGLVGDGLGVTFITSRFLIGNFVWERLAGIPEAEGVFFFDFIFFFFRFIKYPRAFYWVCVFLSKTVQ